MFFQRASFEGRGTPSDVSDRREGHFQRVLSRYLMPGQRIAKGGLVGVDGYKSQSIDCVVLSSGHPSLVDQNGDISLILAEGVDAAIEVKPDISNKVELRRALAQGISVKKIFRQRTGLLDLTWAFEGREDMSAKDFAHRIPFIIFATRTYSDYEKLIREVCDYYLEFNVPRSQQFDMIVVNHGGVLINVAPNSLHINDKQRSMIWVPVSENSFGFFLSIFLKYPMSEAAIGGNVLSSYISFGTQSAKHVPEVDEILLQLG
ncbi:DUF6602 domain-containing protein [Pseudooceanicola onchidii]|uniref:DUF6602 domain-containing protein n=1 Tax=Pseudooceanicola onchidii TaxID=2562279 RepID=UPI0010A9D539|nr:DUF6602 domain-containing protein [Pseudooceanicola onchidii]